ncbi:hypothetical protein Tco_0914259 [Tanacetum coccineum]
MAPVLSRPSYLQSSSLPLFTCTKSNTSTTNTTSRLCFGLKSRFSGLKWKVDKRVVVSSSAVAENEYQAEQKKVKDSSFRPHFILQHEQPSLVNGDNHIAYKFKDIFTLRLIDVMVALVEVAEASNSRTLPSFHFLRQQNIVKGSSQPSKTHSFLPQGQLRQKKMPDVKTTEFCPLAKRQRISPLMIMVDYALKIQRPQRRYFNMTRSGVSLWLLVWTGLEKQAIVETTMVNNARIKRASIDSSWLRLIDAVPTVVEVAEASNSRTLPSVTFPRSIFS